MNSRKWIGFSSLAFFIVGVVIELWPTSQKDNPLAYVIEGALGPILVGFSMILFVFFLISVFTFRLMGNKTLKIMAKVLKISLISIGVLSLLVTAFFYYSYSSVVTKKYGYCSIQYVKYDFTETEVDKLADIFSKEGLFGTLNSVDVLLDKGDDVDYKISIPISSGDVKQEEFKRLRKNIQSYLPNNTIIIAVFVDDSNNIVQTFE